MIMHHLQAVKKELMVKTLKGKEAQRHKENAAC
jgi:hypothetical protein